MDTSSREQRIEFNRLNSYLSMNTAKKLALSPEGFAMVALVLNNCNPTKPRKITRPVFINFYLQRDYQMPIDVSAIGHLVDQSQGVDHSVDDLFKQIRGEVKSDDVFQRSFNVDPKISNALAGFAQNIFGRLPAPPPSQGVEKQAPSGLGGILGLLGENQKVEQSLPPAYSVSQQQRLPSQPISGTFGRPAQAETSQYIKSSVGYDEIRDRPPRNPRAALEAIYSMADASVISSNQERPWNPDPKEPVKNNPPPVNPLRYYGSQLVDPQESRQPYLPQVGNSQKPVDHEGDQSLPQTDFLGGRAAHHGILDNQPKQLKPLDESSFLNYQEIKPAESFVYQAEDIKAKMDPTVRNNLKRFEYDF